MKIMVSWVRLQNLTFLFQTIYYCIMNKENLKTKLFTIRWNNEVYEFWQDVFHTLDYNMKLVLGIIKDATNNGDILFSMCKNH